MRRRLQRSPTMLHFGARSTPDRLPIGPRSTPDKIGHAIDGLASLLDNCRKRRVVDALREHSQKRDAVKRTANQAKRRTLVMRSEVIAILQHNQLRNVAGALAAVGLGSEVVNDCNSCGPQPSPPPANE